MHALRTTEMSNAKIVPIGKASERYPMSRNTLTRIAEDAHAIVRIGRMVYINTTLLDRYIDSISE